MKLLFAFILFPIVTFAQKEFDSKIIVVLNDTVDCYTQIKTAFANADFSIRENGRKDTIITHTKEVEGLPGNMIAIAVSHKDTIELTGFYSLKRINLVNIALTTKGAKPVIYFKGSKTWIALNNIAKYLSGKIYYTN